MGVKKLAILGSTGSIGKSTLEVVAAHRERFPVVSLAAARSVEDPGPSRPPFSSPSSWPCWTRTVGRASSRRCCPPA